MRLRDQHVNVSNVPVLERLDLCGALGIAGPKLWAESAARSVAVQLTVQHSPADLVVTAFATAEQAETEWGWLKWLPHVDSAHTPLVAAHLADDRKSAAALVTELEGLIASRTGKASGDVRSRLTEAASDTKERLSPVTKLSPTPAVVVFVLTDSIVDRARLVGIAEDGASVGIHVVWVASGIEHVPAACRTTVEVWEQLWRVHFVRQGLTVPLTHVDTVSSPQTDQYGRSLAPFTDAGARVLEESDLPKSVALAGLLPGDVLGSADSIIEAWQETHSIVENWSAGLERDPGVLSAVVGQGNQGTVSLDLRTHGPHALVGGTTGSGKSEFLQSWILSLASRYSPDRLTFLLVDYKGGAAFADCVDLPHTVGLVTDLNTHLVRRALTSLRAELRFREELLADKGAKDLIALERRGDPETPPNLVIVIDEFAALVSEIPDFVDGVIDVAQRGRSLGLHLVMATQRPAGVIKDNLRANTNLRVGLRMADPADSTDVLGVNDAAWFAPDTPGRSAVKIGAGRLTHFQAGYLGGRSETEHAEPAEVQTLDFGEQTPWAITPESRPQRTGRWRDPRDIEVLASHIQEAAASLDLHPPRKPWLDSLPEVLPLSRFTPTKAGQNRSQAANSKAGSQPATPTLVTWGMADEPHLQRQSPYVVNLSEVGNLALYGGAGSGKTTGLISFACSMITSHPDSLVYGIDAAGGRLGILAGLPNTGDIISADDRDRTLRLLGMLKTMTAQRTHAATRAEPSRVLLLIDGFQAFRDTYEHLGGGAAPFQDLAEIARGGRNCGVHIVFASERATPFPAALAATIPERLVLRLPSDTDYQNLAVPAGALKDAAPGRCVKVGDDTDIQLGLPALSGDPADIDEAVLVLAEAQIAASVPQAEGIREVPERISRGELDVLTQAERAEGAPSASGFAIDTTSLAQVSTPEDGLMLVTGPAGSGRTTAVQSLLETIIETAQHQGVHTELVLLAPRRSALHHAQSWKRLADANETRSALIEDLTRGLGGVPSKPSGLQLLPLIGATPEDDASSRENIALQTEEQVIFPTPGRRGVVVIEDIGGFDGTGDEHALAALLKLLRRSDLLVIVEGENATLGSVWELAAPLKGSRWALALQPDQNDTPSLFTVQFTHAKRESFPPGRGYLIRGGKLTGVHVALPNR